MTIDYLTQQLVKMNSSSSSSSSNKLASSANDLIMFDI